MAVPMRQVPTQNALQYTLDAGYTAGGTVLTLSSTLTGIVQAPGVCVVDRVDTSGNTTPSKRDYFTFSGVSGATLTGCSGGQAGSTNQDHAVGAIVEFIPDVVWAQSLYDTISAEHSTSGIHDATKVMMLAGAQTVTGAKTFTTGLLKAVDITSGSGVSTFPTTTDTLVARTTTDTLTNKTMTDSTNNVMAKSLKSATTTVDVSAATAPSSGQVLTATSSTAATWQTPSTTALTSQTKQFTRDVAGGAGDVAYTGVGFVPTAIHFSYMTIDGKCVGTGYVDSSKDMVSYFSAQQAGYTTGDSATDKCIYVSNASGTNQQALLKTFDADGFTLTWNKTGSPTGTIHVIAMCYK